MNRQELVSVLAALFILVAGAAVAQQPVEKPDVPTGGTCDPEFDADIGGSMAQPTGAIQFFDGDCTGAPDNCGDYFDIRCPVGAAGNLFVSTCDIDNGGVVPSFDTSLSVFDAGVEQDCNDDSCAGFFLASTIPAFPMSGGVTYRVRIGSFSDGQAGTYRLAYQAPSTCLIGPAIPVELIEFEIE